MSSRRRRQLLIENDIALRLENIDLNQSEGHYPGRIQEHGNIFVSQTEEDVLVIITLTGIWFLHYYLQFYVNDHCRTIYPKRRMIQYM